MEILKLKLEKFNELLKVLNKEKEYEFRLDFYSDVISIVEDKPLSEIENMEFEEHNKLFGSIWNELSKINDYKSFPNEVRIGTETFYTNAVNNGFSFKTKEFRLIQEIVGKSDYIFDFAAIIWKEKDGLLTKEAIDIRKEKLKILEAGNIISYINKLSEYLIK